MFSLNLTKFFAVSALSLILFSGCGWWRKSVDSNSPAVPPIADDLKSEIPFSTKEPQRFQAEIVVTAGETERRTFVARDGERYRYDFNFGAPNQLTYLQTDKNYQILPALKIYTESTGGISLPTDDWTNFLTTEWLSKKTDAKFEKLETTDNLTKYRVQMGDGDAFEVFVYLDEKIGLPVKQEFYSTGGQKRLTYLFELKNFKLETDADLFTVPADSRRVSTEEFSKLVWKTVYQTKDKK